MAQQPNTRAKDLEARSNVFKAWQKMKQSCVKEHDSNSAQRHQSSAPHHQPQLRVVVERERTSSIASSSKIPTPVSMSDYRSPLTSPLPGEQRHMNSLYTPGLSVGIAEIVLEPGVVSSNLRGDSLNESTLGDSRNYKEDMGNIRAFHPDKKSVSTIGAISYTISSDDTANFAMRQRMTYRLAIGQDCTLGDSDYILRPATNDTQYSHGRLAAGGPFNFPSEYDSHGDDRGQSLAQQNVQLRTVDLSLTPPSALIMLDEDNASSGEGFNLSTLLLNDNHDEDPASSRSMSLAASLESVAVSSQTELWVRSDVSESIHARLAGVHFDLQSSTEGLEEPSNPSSPLGGEYPQSIHSGSSTSLPNMQPDPSLAPPAMPPQSNPQMNYLDSMMDPSTLKTPPRVGENRQQRTLRQQAGAVHNGQMQQSSAWHFDSRQEPFDKYFGSWSAEEVNLLSSVWELASDIPK